MNLILIAPPAAGKGTQSELIVKKYNLQHISTGDLLREVLNNGSEIGKEIKEKMNSGALIDDDIIMNLVENKIKDTDGFVFDGFPRNINQAKSLDELLKKLNKKIDFAIYLKIDRDIACQRITSRYVCPECNSVYNIKEFNHDLCSKCGHELIKREDDTEQVFNNRYDVYMNETKPVIDYYNDLGLLYEVDSSLKPEEVFEKIEEVLDDKH